MANFLQDYLVYRLATFLLAWIITLVVIVLPPIIFTLWMVVRSVRTHGLRLRTPGRTSVAFFHPYCNSGGGGERVLWCAIRALQQQYQDIDCIVYSGDSTASGDEIVARAAERFGITLLRPIKFHWLSRRAWLEAERYPYFTLLGQSFGSLFVGWEALSSHVPDVYIDTTGYAFTLPLFRYVGGSRVACYVHYPTVSSDMLARVRRRTTAHNNSSRIADSAALSFAKFIYYTAFARLYSAAGRCCHAIMVNSSWTRGHIEALWQPAVADLCTVYPPCSTDEFLKLPAARPSEGVIVSIGQFRPEKDHELQLAAFKKFLETSHNSGEGQNTCEKKAILYKLLLVGSCRNSEDSDRVAKLQNLCEKLGISHAVEFRVNVTFDEVKKCLGEATIGLHAMWNEHFGIGIVECMAAGAIVLAHNSGGPKLDIVTTDRDSRTGFLADNPETYAEAMRTIFSMPMSERQAVVERGRQSMQRFSEKEFEKGFTSAVSALLQSPQM